MKLKILGYAPDADPSVVGVLTNCNQIIPTVRGFKAAPSPVSSGNSVLAATCQGAAALEQPDATTRFFAASPTALYEQSGVSWADRSATAYGATNTDRWRFAQFGGVSLAIQKQNVLQASSASGAFSQVTAAPKASIVEVANNFVFLFNTNEATYGDSTNRWWCAALNSYTDWTPAIATQCATGILQSSPGKILAGRMFGAQIVAYKEKSMYLGTYVGPPVVWSWDQIPGEVGALCQEVVVNVGTPEQPKHIFMGPDNFYSFDGSRPVPVGNEVKEKVFNEELNRTYSYLSIALHDKTKSTIRFFYCSSGSTMPDKCVVYNYKTGRWGRDDRTIEYAVEWVAGGTTYDNAGSSYATYNDLPSTPYDTTFFSPSSPIPSIFTGTHELKTLTGAANTSTFTLGDIGDSQVFSTLSRVIPRFIIAPTSANIVEQYKNDLGSSLTSESAVSMDSNKRFDLMRSARFHRPRIDMVGDAELAEIDVMLVRDGDE